jgi:hypothetical protein
MVPGPGALQRASSGSLDNNHGDWVKRGQTAQVLINEGTKQGTGGLFGTLTPVPSELIQGGDQ